ncbi:fimbrial protein [Serratia fonticola]|uniref:fimbrial protein n=1 Tax=Serratia fonticola TaxID=47917 RepID=UPI00192B373E|nr:fimbrial protein [Serratia fonticola]MBL5902944.1 type 1 fimbrial protein [Serratia fonticola]
MKENNKKTLLALLVLSAGFYHTTATAVDVNITGTVVASPCTVDTANSNLSVNLGDNIAASDLATAGSYGGVEKTFTISLKDCPASTTKAVATFSGSAYSGEASMFASTGTATGVGVKIKQAAAAWTDTTVNPSQGTWTQTVSSTAHTASFPFSARPYTSVGSVPPGTIVSVMQVAFTYQ